MIDPPKDLAKWRVAALMLMSALLPPLGTLIVLRSTRINMRGKALFSGLALVSMTLIFGLFVSGRAVQTAIRPAPAVPAAIGYAVPTAVPAPVSRDSQAITDGEVNSTDPMDDTPQNQVPKFNGALTVYSVRSNATLYHRSDSCDGQTNRRSLTLAEAVAENLSPCPKCLPNGQP